MSCARAVLPRVVSVVIGAVTAAVATLTFGPPSIARAQDGVEVALAEAGGCPGLFVLGVQGTGQSTPNSPVAADAGLLSLVLGPLTEMLSGPTVGRAYVPYLAGFGGALPGATSAPYSVSAEEGLGRLRDMAAEVTDHCPRSQLGLIGYSQGAHVVSMFAREVGTGQSVISADRIAAVALLADPTRAPGAGVFPGLPDTARPEPAPGTTGAELGALQEFPQHPAPGGGIGPLRDIAPDFGELTGRVASMCLPGDLACDAPTDAPLLHMVVNILGQAELIPSDPVTALSSIADGFSATLGRTATAVVTHDLRGYSLGTLRLTPEKPLGVRLAEAADPRSVSEPQAREALLKLGTSALNTLLAIIGIALEPAEVAAVATAPDPLSGLDRATTALIDAVRRPLPRRTVFNLVTKTFDALGQLSAENAELLDPVLWLRYADTVRKHGDYFHAGYTADGRPATDLVLQWFAAVAEDLATNRIPEPAPGRAAPAGPALDESGGAPAPRPPGPQQPAPRLPVPQQPPPPVVQPEIRNVAVGAGAQPQPRADAAAQRPPYDFGPYLLGLVLLGALSAGACSAIRIAHRWHGLRQVTATGRPRPPGSPRHSR
ncbi:cutinase family protein [Nocardia sp. NBC_01329]|uniref:cutinase family protein n=1 Tax=Nocardia sp. NBC_01329 TaxID=2903594 RepID=UPI002E14C53C|nr:cutinase family protein [Nocardia sp. NBC_01329]